MKTTLLAFGASALVLTSSAHAGVNGTYRVTGSETVNGQRYAFTGTVAVSNYKSGTYAFRFSDGERVNYVFNFSRPLKETKLTQTVSAFNNLGTSSATFVEKGGKATIKFTYRSKDGSVRGTGSGSK
jgi:hypothetical protein